MYFAGKRGHALRIIAILLVASSFCLMLGGCNTEASRQRKSFEQGVEYYDNGELELARQCFIEANGYGTSAGYLEAIDEYENLYIQAVAMVNDHDYINAYRIFSAIPKYGNSADYIAYIDDMKSKFESGEALYETGDYLAARAYFESANGYAESIIYIENIDNMSALYNQGMEYKNAGNFADAIVAFQAINANFEGSEALIQECIDALAVLPPKVRAYIMHYNNEYPDGSVAIEAGNITAQFVLSDNQGVLFTGVADETEGITYLSFWFSPELVAQLGESGYLDALARCIHALNPYAEEFSTVRAGIQSYLDGTRAYGCMQISSQVDNSGSIVVNAIFELSDD